jgi:MSHA biogenesis protein MshO
MPRSDTRLLRAAGFTLIEAVMVMAITGALAAVAGRFIVQPVQGYLATTARANLTDTADNALRTMARELRSALANSVRVTADHLSLELIPTTSAALYQTEGTGALVFGSVATSFNLIGPGLTLAAGQDLVFYNLGPGITESDAYSPNSSAAQQATSNRRSATSAGTVTTVSFSSVAGLPVADFAPPYRVFAVSQPITYRCDTAAGTLTRITGYGFQSNQPDPPSGGSSALLAHGVSGCAFNYDASPIAARAGLVNLQLKLSTVTHAGTETVALQQAVHVNNLP